MMKLEKTINLKDIFQQSANKIIADRDRAGTLHPSNIRACGNEIENSVRNFLEDRIPSKYHIGQGHIINSSHYISPQLDVMITDSTTLPILLKTSDCTEYNPIESVYAIGEVKSTYKNSNGYIESFCDTIKTIKCNLGRISIENTAYNGLKNKTLLEHTVISCPNPTLNPLFSFMLFVDAGNFKWEHMNTILGKYDSTYLPNLIVLLNQGCVFKGHLNDGKLNLDYYPEYGDGHSVWIYSGVEGTQDNAGTNLALLYHNLLVHLASCSLEAPNYMSYFSDLLEFKKSNIVTIT